MSRDFPVRGLADLEKFLTALPKKLQKAALRQGLTAAAEPIVQEARSRAPSSKIGRAIKKGSPRQNQDGTFSIRIYVDEKREDGFLGYFFEYGVRPHLITSGDAKPSAAALNKRDRKAGGAGPVDTGKVSSVSGERIIKIGDAYISGAIMHPGFGPRPFLVPALDVRAEDAVNACAAKIKAFIEGRTGLDVPVDEAA